MIDCCADRFLLSKTRQTFLLASEAASTFHRRLGLLGLSNVSHRHVMGRVGAVTQVRPRRVYAGVKVKGPP